MAPRSPTHEMNDFSLQLNFSKGKHTKTAIATVVGVVHLFTLQIVLENISKQNSAERLKQLIEKVLESFFCLFRYS